MSCDRRCQCQRDRTVGAFGHRLVVDAGLGRSRVVVLIRTEVVDRLLVVSLLVHGGLELDNLAAHRFGDRRVRSGRYLQTAAEHLSVLLLRARGRRHEQVVKLQ